MMVLDLGDIPFKFGIVCRSWATLFLLMKSILQFCLLQIHRQQAFCHMFRWPYGKTMGLEKHGQRSPNTNWSLKLGKKYRDYRRQAFNFWLWWQHYRMGLSQVGVSKMLSYLVCIKELCVNVNKNYKKKKAYQSLEMRNWWPGAKHLTGQKMDYFK